MSDGKEYSKMLHPIIRTREEGEAQLKEKGGELIYCETVINAPVATIRAKLLDFKTWSEWNEAIPKPVVSGNIDDLDSTPAPDIDIGIGTKPQITLNTEDGFGWSVNMLCGCMCYADHMFIFEPVDGGRATKFIHYERAKGFLGWMMKVAMHKSTVETYEKMNVNFKKQVEDSIEDSL